MNEKLTEVEKQVFGCKKKKKSERYERSKKKRNTK
jgi:hypothetical protein